MVKACNAFGVNFAGFEHEILDMILRMDRRSQSQRQQQNSITKHAKKGKKKGEIEQNRLKCGINYDGKF